MESNINSSPRILGEDLVSFQYRINDTSNPVKTAILIQWCQSLSLDTSSIPLNGQGRKEFVVSLLNEHIDKVYNSTAIEELQQRPLECIVSAVLCCAVLCCLPVSVLYF